MSWWLSSTWQGTQCPQTQSPDAPNSRRGSPRLVSHATWQLRPAHREIPALPVDTDGAEVQDAGCTHHDVQGDKYITANAAEVPDSTCHLSGRDKSVSVPCDPVISAAFPRLPCTCDLPSLCLAPLLPRAGRGRGSAGQPKMVTQERTNSQNVRTLELEFVQCFSKCGQQWGAQ